MECKELASRIANINIIHPKVQRIWNTLDSIREHKKLGDGSNTPRHLFIIGQGGVGKSQLAKRYAAKHQCYVHTDEFGTEYDIKPVVYVELPDPFTVNEFYQSIIKALGAPQLLGRPTIGEVKRQAFNLLEKQRVEMILLDEMDFILVSKYVKEKEAMEAIKHCSNAGNVSLVCIGTPETKRLAKLNFQHYRRFPIIEFNRFPECNEEFCKLLRDIESQINPPEPIGLGIMDTGLPEMLFAMTKGVIGLLTPTIQEAYRLMGVFNEGFNDLSTVRLSVDIITEAFDNIAGDFKEEDFEEMIKK